MTVNRARVHLVELSVVAVTLAFHGAASAQATSEPALLNAQFPAALFPSHSSSSSSASSSAEPFEVLAEAPVPVAQTAVAAYRVGPSTQPFHALAVGLVVGDQGIGVQIATPLARRIQLRAGGQLLGVSANFTNDGLNGNGQVSLENVYTSVDFYPFRRSSFHLSPGITLHNDSHLTATLNAPGGTSFSLGDANYTSDPNNPIHGQARFLFGNSVAPRFTAGFGNMLPRNGSHFSFPVEFGFQVISAPVVQLYLQGNGCDNSGDCGDINADGGAQNIQDEINELESDLKPLRIYPLFSFGVSYRFGRSYDRVR